VSGRRIRLPERRPFVTDQQGFSLGTASAVPFSVRTFAAQVRDRTKRRELLYCCA